METVHCELSNAPVQLQLNLSGMCNLMLYWKKFTHFLTTDRLNERPTKKELREHVWKKVVEKWVELAIELGLDDLEDDDGNSWLDNIRKNEKDNNLASYDVLTCWLKNKRVKPTWNVLINALRKLSLQDAMKSVNDFLSLPS